MEGGGDGVGRGGDGVACAIWEGMMAPRGGAGARRDAAGALASPTASASRVPLKFGPLLTARSPPAVCRRYLKYLTKKYLKKQQLRDYLHVVATLKTTYELRYFSINAEGDEEE